jgi:hypothetical protein
METTAVGVSRACSVLVGEKEMDNTADAPISLLLLSECPMCGRVFEKKYIGQSHKEAEGCEGLLAPQVLPDGDS